MFSLLSFFSLANILTGTLSADIIRLANAANPTLTALSITQPAITQLALQPAERAAERAAEPAASQTIAQAEGNFISIPQEVRPLPGGLDKVPVFNSNSPEIIASDGILLSTFPSGGKSDPSAHLNRTFSGRFDVFSHHVARGQNDTDTRTIYEAILVHNPGDRPVTLSIRDGASYLSQEAAWNEIASGSSNLYSNNFSGPGSRVMNDVLRDRRLASLPPSVTIAPGESHLLLNTPIPLRRLNVATDGTLAPGSELTPPPTNASSGEGPRLNGRSTLMRLESSGPVHVASLAMRAPQSNGKEIVPSLESWKQILFKGQLVTPRDGAPSQPGSRDNPFRYGRVSGVVEGSQWKATLADDDSSQLAVPAPGEHISYAISTLERNTFGTGQIQSAPVTLRYDDTAYRANGNYGVEYNLNLPLANNTDSPKKVALSVQTPLQNEGLENALQFNKTPESRVFFRGTVLFIYNEDNGRPRAFYTYLVQNRGEQGKSLIEMTLAPGEQRDVNVQFLYPPDSTPPQVLTISTKE